MSATKGSDGLTIGIAKPNADGSPVDVLANLRFKREVGEALLPGVLQMTEDILNASFLQGETDTPEHKFLQEEANRLKEVAKAFNISLEDNNEQD